MYRRWRDSRGKDKEYENIIRKQVLSTRLEADKDNVVVPTTLEDYCIKTSKPRETVDMTDFFVDDYDLDDCDGDDSADDDYADGDDSGNGESWLGIDKPNVILRAC